MKKQIKFLLQLSLTISLIISCKSNQENQATSKPKKSIAEAMTALPNATIDETIDYYYTLKKEQPDSYNFNNENELDSLGFEYLDKGNTKSAIEIFKLLVAEFPDAFNSYNSLAYAYFTDKNEELAIKNYEKSLELNPDNDNLYAEDFINKSKYKKYDATRFYKIYPLEYYEQDLDELARRLTEVHPNPYKFITKEAFWKLVNTKKKLLTEHITFSEFIWICSEIVASMNCSHTFVGYFFHQERKMIPMDLRFPLEVRLINNALYVSDALINENKVKVKEEIIAINGIPFETIKEKIYKHISSQGYIETSKKNFLNEHSTTIIPYALDFPKSYTIHIKNREEPIALVPLTSYENTVRNFTSYLCKETLCVTYPEDGKTAIMTIGSFNYYGNRISEFKDFMDSSFNDFTDKKISNLVIDVRGNMGGSPDAGMYLLRYISKEPFTYFANYKPNEQSNSVFKDRYELSQPLENTFKGSVYFTMDGTGNSTTGHFMSLVKHLKLGTLIGEELGSNQFCSGGQVLLRLPNTGIKYSVGSNTYETTATSLPADRGIMPDYEVHQSIDDYLNNKDSVMEYVINMIKKK